MYDDNVTVKVGVNWKEIVIKVVLLIIFILILCWLFPKPNLDIFYDSVYTKNINTMKEAAKTYYTTDRLPQTVGESKSMTLKEMIDNHMIIRFTDKNGKTCDESASKVEVTKISDKEYALKVILNCGDDKDYIIETIGCNSVCTGEGCTIINNNTYVSDNTNNNGNNNNNNGNNTNNGSQNNNQDDDGTYNEDGTPVNGGKAGYDTSYTIDTVYYQFRKAITTTSTVYSCPTGYTRNGTKCSKYVIGAEIDATKNYYPDQTIVEDAKYTQGGTTIVYADPIKKENDPTYTCPSGYTLNGSYCVKYTDAKEETVTTYTCPSGYTKNDTKCYRTYDATYTPGTDGYTCPNGGTLNTSTKKCTITQDATSQTSYTCPSGYTRNGTSCYKVYDATYTAGTTTYTCPSGYTRNNTKCYKTIDATYTAGTTTYSCPSGYTRNNTKCYKTYDATYTAGSTTYSCPQGGTRSGTTCTITTSATATEEWGAWSSSTFYSPSAGLATSCSGNVSSCVQYLGTVTGSVCGSPCGNKGVGYRYARKTRSKVTSYSCPSGYTRSGTTCSYSYTATATTGEGSYSCPQGGTRSGTKCTIETNATATTGEGSYSCPSGYDRSGTKCTHTIDATATTGEGSYSCPQGGTRSGTKCTITTTATQKVDYSCPSGFTLNESTKKCTKTYDATHTGGEGSYTCPEGGTRSGTKCTITKDADKKDETKYTCPSGYTLNSTTKKCEAKVEPTKVVTYTYSCPTGYTKSGEGENTKCSKEVTGEGRYYCEYADAVLSDDHKCTRVVKGEFSHYTCPSTDYILSGDKCKKESTEVIDATATTKTSTSYKYTWSKYSSLKGWEFTGKTKVVSEKYQGGQQ